MKSANLAAKFLLELAALASLAYWGAVVGGVALAVLAPLAMAVVWGTFAAPKAKRRLAPRARIPLELTVFALAAAALAGAGHPVLAVILAAVMAVNAMLLTAFQQWES